MNTTLNHVKDLYCLRVDYYRGAEVSNAVRCMSRPIDNSGRDIWGRIAQAIDAANVELEPFIDWCFKEAIPGLPFLNAVPTSMLEDYLSRGKPNTVRDDVNLHIKIMFDRFDVLVSQPLNECSILFDDRFEFHCVFALKMAEQLGLNTPENTGAKAEYLSKVFPHYHRELDRIFKEPKP